MQPVLRSEMGAIALVLFFVALFNTGMAANITVSASTLSELSSDQLTISCTPGQLDASAIFLMKVLKTGVKAPLATLYDNDHVATGPGNIQADGLIKKGQWEALSYLNVTFTDLTSDDSGSYTCEITYLDVSGYTRTSSASTIVKVTKADIKTLEYLVKGLRNRISDLEDSLDSKETNLEAMNEKNEVFRTKINNLETDAKTKSTEFKNIIKLVEGVKEHVAKVSTILEKNNIDNSSGSKVNKLEERINQLEIESREKDKLIKKIQGKIQNAQITQPKTNTLLVQTVMAQIKTTQEQLLHISKNVYSQIDGLKKEFQSNIKDQGKSYDDVTLKITRQEEVLKNELSTQIDELSKQSNLWRNDLNRSISDIPATNDKALTTKLDKIKQYHKTDFESLKEYQDDLSTNITTLETLENTKDNSQDSKISRMDKDYSRKIAKLEQKQNEIYNKVKALEEKQLAIIDRAHQTCLDVTWTRVDHTCFKVFDAPLSTWAAASQYCHQRNNGSLVSIEDEQKNNFVKGLVSDHTKYTQFWIGANDLGREGRFEWESLNSDPIPITRTSFEGWAVSYPRDTSGTSDCVYISRTDGFWYDYTCTSKIPFVCQAPAVWSPFEHL